MHASTYFLTHYAIKAWEWLIHPGLPLAALAVLAVLIPRIGRLCVRVVAQRLDADEESTKSKLALAGALVYLVEAVVYFIIAIRALTLLGVPAASAAVPATVVSAAIGFGAQNIIGDFLSGVFIITERQFGVGDYVSFEGTNNAVEGTVVALTLRATKLRTASGEMVTVPNGKVGAITNFSQDWSRAFVEIDIPLRPGENNDHLVSQVEKATKRAVSAPDVKPNVTGDVDVMPAIAVVQPQAAGQPWAVTFRVTVDVIPAKQWAVERAIRSAILNTFWERMETVPASPFGAKEASGTSIPHSTVPGAAPTTAADDSAPTTVFATRQEASASPQSSPHDGVHSTDTSRLSDDDDSGTPLDPAEEVAIVRSKDDGPGSASDGALIVGTEDDDEEDLDSGVFKRYDYSSRFQRWLTFGGRTRVSTTLLFIALAILGLLAAASSNPDDGRAGVLNPAYWSDRPAKTSEQTESPAPEPSQPATQDSSEQEGQQPQQTGQAETPEPQSTQEPNANNSQREPQNRAPQSQQQNQNQNQQPDGNRGAAAPATTGADSGTATGDSGGNTGGF
ncbi:mechanosensitive ion channel domain-containing protein [Corynebacterium sp. UMB4614]|uniref:mechanosensitive ion channel domain-containing protein n=1 Tax=Corynebacterium sp. UMB4614 TaxID=3046334 RepID=UPI002549FE87|nr:mechanosensitive ion channel domain-containing protein [Corynebacterium sp. UMB4614]MDK7134734.1 mechanosensitive ion channel [Corynebacterium sp. UMB4614]